MAAKLTDKKIIELLTELKQGDADFFDPSNGNFESDFYNDKKFARYAVISNPGALQYLDDALR
jgi:hypothetical protein